ncbi:MAG: diguanylate cyclase [Chloroflexia bacterium]
MIETEIAPEEARRIALVRALHLLDTPSEERFDRITRTAARLLNMPIALISLADADRHWFKSSVGLDLPEVARDHSFWDYTLRCDEIFFIRDAQDDPRFAAISPVVGEPHARYYAGCPLSAPDGTRLGVLCVMDRAPRQLGAADLVALGDLAAWAGHELMAGGRGSESGPTVDTDAPSTEPLLRALLDNLAEGVVIFDERDNIESFNREAERMFGYKALELAGRNIQLLLPGYQVSTRPFAQVVAGDYPAITQSPVFSPQSWSGRHKDGALIPLEISVSQVLTPSGALCMAILRDTTRYMVAEEALRKNETLFQSLLATVEEGVVLQDASGTILAANAGIERILELPAGRLVGQEQPTARWRTVHEDGQVFPVSAHPPMAALRTGEAQLGVTMGFHMPNGSLKWVSINSQPIFQPGDPQPYAVISAITDLTGQRAAREELMQAQERFFGICNNTTEMVSVHDPKGTFIFAGASCTELLGYAPDELTKTNVFGHIHPEDVPLVRDSYRKLSATGTGCSLKYRLRRKSAEYIWVETHASAVVGLHVGDIEILSVSHKLRARRNMQASMHEQIRLAPRHVESLNGAETPSLRDDLTSLLNRRAIEELLNFKLASPRSSNYPFGCLILDLDEFGRVNDTYGREAGDVVLQKMGQLLAQSCRAEDYVARYSDDEFLLVLPNTDASGTVLVAERIVNTVRVANWPSLPREQKLTVSIGGTCVRRPSDLQLAELLEIIDSQLAHAKAIGRDRLVMNARETAMRY